MAGRDDEKAVHRARTYRARHLANYHAVVTNPPMSASADWDLQVELTWNGAGRRDWNVERVLGFNDASCKAT